MKGKAEEVPKRQSVNPFYVTTAHISQLAASPQNKKIDVPEARNLAPARDPNFDGGNFGFLWKRESDNIGKGIGTSGSKLASCIGHYSSPREKALKLTNGEHSVQCETEESQIAPPPLRDDTYQPVGNRSNEKQLVKEDLQEILTRSFRHSAKEEHAMFTTTSNKIGKKGPTVATFTFDRVARQQKFSNSFPKSDESRDTGLNTSITRSSVHSSLDHF